MVFAIWLVPLALAVLVVGLVALVSTDSGSEPSTRRWSVAPDGRRLGGMCVLALGGLAAVWIGVGDHQPRSVLSGSAPFDWSAAFAVGGAAALVGGVLLLSDWSRRRRQASSTEPASDTV